MKRLPIFIDYHFVLSAIMGCKHIEQFRNCEHLIDSFVQRNATNVLAEAMGNDLRAVLIDLEAGKDFEDMLIADREKIVHTNTKTQ